MSSELTQELSSFEHALREVRDVGAGIQVLGRQLEVLLERLITPADLETHVLTQANPVRHSRVGDGRYSNSIGLLNPTGINVYLGVGGNAPTAQGRAPAVPPSSALVLPVFAANLEIGADPADLVAGDAVVYLFRFPTVQPFYFGSV